MPPPRQVEAEDGVRVSWLDIVSDWDTIVADLWAVYGSAVDAVSGWLDLRRMILGLMGRRESVFATRLAAEHAKRLEATEKARANV